MDDNKNVKENGEKGTPRKHTKKSGPGLKILAVLLTIAVVLLGIKAFWPSDGKKPKIQPLSDMDVILSEEAESKAPANGNAENAEKTAQSTLEDTETSVSEQSSEAQESSEAPEESSTLVEASEESSSEEPSQDEAALYVLTYSEANTWEEGGAKMRTLELALENQTSETVRNWTLVLTIDGLKSVSGWNGTYTIQGDELTVTPADYNSELFANGALYLGCNLGTKSNLKIKSAALNGKACAIRGGKVDQDAINSGNAAQGNNQNANDPEEQGAGQSLQALLTRPANAKQGDDWLHTDGRRILDKDGKQVWLTGVNWFGYNTGTNTFDGLWNSRMDTTVKAIADHGFNLIRVPFSAQLINEWAAGTYPQANFNQAYNTAMTKMNSLEIFDYFLALAEASGIKVMIDIHSAETNAAGHNVNLWFTDKVSVEQYYAALEWMAERYKNNDTIIAYDLKNEPHGKPYEGNAAAIWNNSKQANNWKYVAETAASKVLAKNPNVLILVEGTEIYPKNSKGDYSSTDEKDYYFNWWGGNLRAVKDFPIDLGKYQDKLVYSPHDYGPTVYEQPWFLGSYDYNSLMKDCWHDNWFYIYENNTAPLLIGEWGGFMREPNLKWMTCMRTLISTYHLNHTFWCLNANSGDTGGLLLDDFTTWDTEKYNFVKEVLWQENGKFVGLDHEIPLGANGISVKNSQGLK